MNDSGKDRARHKGVEQDSNMSENRLINCNICKSDRWKILWEQTPFRVVKCSSCGLIYQNPVNHENRISEIFGEEYFTNNYLRYANERTDYFHAQLKRLQPFIGSRGRLLDVGCGVGFFMKVAQNAGWEVCGVEPSPYAANYGFKFCNADIKQDELRGSLFPQEYFDLITFWDVLAYVADPTENIKIAGKLLKKGGTLLVKTQHWSEFTFRLASVLERFMDTRGSLHIPYALYFFNGGSLTRILDDEGYKVASLDYIKDVSKKEASSKGMKQRAARQALKLMKTFNRSESIMAIATK